MLINCVRITGCMTLSAILLGATPAAAQFPGSGGVCALVNFQFCDQPVAPAYAPDPAPRAQPMPSADHRKHRRKASGGTSSE